MRFGTCNVLCDKDCIDMFCRFFANSVFFVEFLNKTLYSSIEKNLRNDFTDLGKSEIY